MIQNFTETYITNPVLKGCVNESIKGPQPFFNDWMVMFENSIQGVNGLLSEVAQDPLNSHSDLTAIHELPKIFPANAGKLNSVECKNIDDTTEWILSLADTFPVMDREINRGHYKKPEDINGGDPRTVVGFYVYDMGARAQVTRELGTEDNYLNIRTAVHNLSEDDTNMILGPERKAADCVVNALCEEAVVAAERAIASGEPCDKIALVGWFDKLGWYKPDYGFTDRLIARAQAIAAVVNPDESAQIFRGLLS